jgi:hypothetical protein
VGGAAFEGTVTALIETTGVVNGFAMECRRMDVLLARLIKRALASGYALATCTLEELE